MQLPHIHIHGRTPHQHQHHTSTTLALVLLCPRTRLASCSAYESVQLCCCLVVEDVPQPRQGLALCPQQLGRLWCGQAAQLGHQHRARRVRIGERACCCGRQVLRGSVCLDEQGVGAAGACGRGVSGCQSPGSSKGGTTRYPQECSSNTLRWLQQHLRMS